MPSKILATPILLLFFAFLFGCDKQEIEDTRIEDFGYDYFPLEVGRSWEYEVDSVIYDLGLNEVVVDSFRSYIREVIVDTLLDNTGLVRYRVERYNRANDTLPWRIERVLTLSRDEQKAVRTEDNLRFTKLVFPIREGKFWDGNAFFDENMLVFVAGEAVLMFEGWQYRILAESAADSIGGIIFEEVVKVQNADNTFLGNYGDVLNLRLAREHYAKGVGLIFRELQILDSDCIFCCDGDTDEEVCGPIPWTEKAEKGFTLRQRLIRYQ